MDQSLLEAIRPIMRVIKRYHPTIMIVIVATLIGLAVFQLTRIVALSSETGVENYTPVSKANGNFDKTTIERIEKLRSKDDVEEPLDFPDRQSPFSE